MRSGVTDFDEPLRFEPNRGQAPQGVAFVARHGGTSIYLSKRGVAWRPGSPSRSRTGGISAGRGEAASPPVRMRFVNGNRSPAISGARLLQTRSNYLVGNDPNAWVTGVPSFAAVVYREVYPKTDVLFHEGEGRLEYDFRLRPGADPHAIRLDFPRAERVLVADDGDLLVRQGSMTLRQKAPRIYQSGGKQQVDGRFVVSGGRVSFAVGDYDLSRPLIIDPVVGFSTYLGGIGFGGESGNAVAVDAAGSTYVTGYTNSLDFPLVAPHDASCGNTAPNERCGAGNRSDVFISKFTPEGDLSYSTFVGGGGRDVATAIALGSGGVVYIGGMTQSTDFPTPNGFDSSCGSPDGCRGGAFFVHWDGFVLALRPDGSGPLYSTYLGGAANDKVSGVAAGPSGTIVATGSTVTGDFLDTLEPPINDFPVTPQAIQGTYGGGAADGFVTRINPSVASSSSLAYSTYLGGPGRDYGTDVAVDSAGNSYITGQAGALFPGATPGGTGAFAAKLNAQGTSLDYSRYLTREDRFDDDDLGSGGIALDQAGNAYVTGTVYGGPTGLGGLETSPGAFQQGYGGPPPGGFEPGDAFVVKLSPGGAVAFATYLGGSYFDSGTAIAVDSSSPPNAYINGFTCSQDFPSILPVAAPGSGCDPFVTSLQAGGSTANYSTTLGGNGLDRSSGIAVGSDGTVSITGETRSTDFPIVRAYQSHNADGGDWVDYKDAFVARITPGDPSLPVVSGLDPPSGTISGGTEVTISGAGLGAASSVTFGDTAVTCPGEGCTVTSGTTIKVTTPAQPAGTGAVPVTVTTPGGTSSANPVATFVYGQGAWQPSAPLDLKRSFFTATLLANGKVLITRTNDSHLYDPATNTWSKTGSLNISRYGFTTTLLRNGNVLAVGGYPADGFQDTTVAEIYDPDTGSWTQTGSSSFYYGHTATRLSNGKVLVTGGEYSKAAEIYDPQTGLWTSAGATTSNHYFGTAVTLDGKVMVAGGCCRPNNDFTSDEAEIYNPAQGWSDAPGSMVMGRRDHTATVLGDQRILVAAGAGSRYGRDAVGDAEVFDGTGWRAVRSLKAVRYKHATVLLPTGEALTVGGTGSSTFFWYETPRIAGSVSSAELFDPTLHNGEGGWRSAGLIGGRYTYSFIEPTATLLSADPDEFVPNTQVCGSNCGKVLVVGSDNQSYLYTPAPTVIGVIPAVGPGDGGTEVVISGTGFTANLKEVAFGDQVVACPSADCRIDSYNKVTVTSPPGEEPEVDVTVVTDGGRSIPVPAGRFQYTGLLPGKVRDLAATAVSSREVSLRFSASGTAGRTPPPASSYVIKQSLEPITAETFDQATSLCAATGGICSASPSLIGDPIKVAVTGLAPSTTYYYALKALDGAGRKGFMSNVAQATTVSDEAPERILDLDAVALSGSEIKLTFSAPASSRGGSVPARRYVIKQSRTPIDTDQEFDTALSLCSGVCAVSPRAVGDKVTVSVTDLTPQTTYFYAVRALNDFGETGPVSDIVQATTLTRTPGSISDLRAKPLSKSKIRLKFSATGSNGASPPPVRTYIVKQSRQRIADAGDFDDAKSLCGGICTFPSAGIGEKLTMTVTHLKRGTRYYYAVRARTPAGELGPMSNIAKATLAGSRRRVTDLKARALRGRRIRLTFSAPIVGGVTPRRFAIEQFRARPRARSRGTLLCGGLCRFSGARAGKKLSLIVDGLKPKTRYFYVLRAMHRGEGGPRSNIARARTS